MKTTKRLVSVLVCLAMVLSMVSNFAFALGGASTMQVYGTTGTSATAGANPTIDHLEKVDLSSSEVYVVDYNMTESDGQTYTLTWDDTPGEAPRTQDYVVGERVFKTIDAAKTAATSAGVSDPIILVKSLAAEINGIQDHRMAVAVTARIYSEAYRTMPYVVGENPEDAWTKNPEYESRAIKLFQINPNTTNGSYSMVIAGFEVVSSSSSDYSNGYGSGFIGFLNKSSTSVQNVQLVNICLNASRSLPDSYYGHIGLPANGTAFPGELEFDNLFIEQAKGGYVFGRSYASAPCETLIVDGLYINFSNIKGLGKSGKSIEIYGNNSSFTLKNANLSNAKVTSGTLFNFYTYTSSSSKGATSSTNHVLNISNNTFVGTVCSVNSTSNTSASVWMGDGITNELIYCNNYVNNIDRVENYYVINSQYSTNHGTNLGQKATFRGNKLIGVQEPKIMRGGSGYVAAQTHWTLDIAENYYTPGYDGSVVGEAWNSTSHGVNCTNYYVNSAMTVLNTDYLIRTAASSANDIVLFNNDELTIDYSIVDGSASDIDITYNGANTTGKWYSDAECTNEVTDLSAINLLSGADTYYIKATNTGCADYSLIYTVNVVRNEPEYELFTDSYISDGIITNDAVYVNPSVAGAGAYVYATWGNKTYTFIKGTNAFASFDAMFDALGTTANPQVLVTSWSGDMNIPYAAEIYAPDYNTVPYIKGTAADGSDWSANPAWTAAANVNNIVIGSTATGAVKLYGLTITGAVKDTSRALGTALDIILENCNITGSSYSSTTMFQLQNSNAPNGNAGNGNQANTDTFQLKNVYIDVSGSVTRIFNEGNPANIVFDGVYFNGKDITSFGTTADVRQTGKNSGFTITNSNFQNVYKETGAWLFFRQFNTYYDMSSDYTYTFTATNNIFNNSAMGYKLNQYGVLHANWDNVTTTLIENNKIFAGSLTPIALMSSEYQGDAGRKIVKNYTITHNYLDGLEPDIALYRSSDSNLNGTPVLYIAENYLTGGVALTSTRQSYTCENYYLDSEMTVLDTDLDVTVAKVNENDIISREGDTINYTVVGSVTPALNVTLGDAMSAYAIYETGTQTAVEIANLVSGTYDIVVSKNGYSKTYTLVVVVDAGVENLFTDTYQGTTVSTNAIVVDYALDSAATYHEVEFEGATYSFVVGVNAFATFDEAIAAAADNGDIIVVNANGSDITITKPVTVLASKTFDADPYTAATNLDSKSERPNAAIDESFANAAAVINNITISSGVTNGNIIIKGFKITGKYVDTSRNTSTGAVSVTLENNLFQTNNFTGNAQVMFALSNEVLKSANNDSFIVKNSWIENKTSYTIRISNGYQPQNMVFDGVVMGAELGVGSYSSYTHGVDINTTFTIKNSTILGELKYYNGEGSYRTTGSNIGFVYDNNTFYNSVYKYGIQNVYINTTDYITFTNNLVIQDADNGYGCIIMVSGDKAGDVAYNGTINFNNNFINYKYPTGAADTNIIQQRNTVTGTIWTINVENANYIAEYDSDIMTTNPCGREVSAINTRFMFTGCGYYWLDSAMTKKSNEIQGDLNVQQTVDANSATIDLADYVTSVYDKFIIKDENGTEYDTTSVAVGPKSVEVYVYATSNDGTAVSDTGTKVTIVRESSIEISNGAVTDSMPEPVEGFEWLSWRGAVKAAGGYYIDTTVTSENYRVGAIYMSGDAELANIKTVLANIRETSMDGAVSKVEELIETYSNEPAGQNYQDIFMMPADKELAWNDSLQAYTYRYNFRVDNSSVRNRATVMYAIYQAEDGTYQVITSDMVIQSTSGPSTIA